MSQTVVCALYKFASLPDYEAIRQPLKDHCLEHGIRGSILLAEEGINGTVAGPRKGIDALLSYLKSDERFADIDTKESYTDDMPFQRMKVRLKQEIVKLGVPEADPTAVVGEYVQGEDWNKLIQDPDVVVIDTRNDYEVELGTFPGALDPKTESFTEFVDYVDQNLDPQKHPKVAMFCTGGIRCEKASSLMLQRGFKQVFHLKGGILQYFEDMPSEDNLWDGDCFVFDDRVTVDKNLAPGNYTLCYACGEVNTPEDRKSDLYKEGLSCPKCHGKLSPEKMKSVIDRHKQHQLKQADN